MMPLVEPEPEMADVAAGAGGATAVFGSGRSVDAFVDALPKDGRAIGRGVSARMDDLGWPFAASGVGMADGKVGGVPGTVLRG